MWAGVHCVCCICGRSSELCCGVGGEICIDNGWSSNALTKY